jgi:hypothetical protein
MTTIYISAKQEGAETIFCLAENKEKYAVIRSNLLMTRIEAEYWILRQALKSAPEGSTIITSIKTMPSPIIEYVCENKQIDIIWKLGEDNIAKEILNDRCSRYRNPQ